METLRRSRGSVKRCVTSFSTFLDSFNDRDTPEFVEILEIEARLKEITPKLNEFNAKHQAILNIIPEDDEDDLFNSEEFKKHEFENLYFAQIARAKSIIIRSTPPLPSAPPTSGTSSTSHQTPIANINAPSSASGSSAAFNSNNGQNNNNNLQQIQLPKINLPTFSGESDCWLEFRDKYVSLIHTNNDIGDMQRFHYLRACLSSEAAMVIQGVEFSTDNYLEAWDMLCARYDNPRVLMHNHIKALFHIEPLQRESAAKLRSMLDNLIKHIGALNRLNKDANADMFALLVQYIITSKFDATTARDWEEGQRDCRLPTIDALKNFIRSKADLLSTLDIKHTDKSNNTNANKHSSKPKYTNTRQYVSANVVNNENISLKCALCKRDHILRNCPDLLKLSPTDRYTKIKSMNRCINCLRFGHQPTDCSAGLCRKCGKKHNTLLHFAPSDLNVQDANVVSNETNTTSLIANSNTLTSSSRLTPCVLLSTALVNVVGACGNLFTARILLDGASESNFITESFANKLGLHLSPVDVTVTGFSLAQSSIRFICRAKISSVRSTFELLTNYLVTPCITEPIPRMRIDTSTFNIPPNISLADPTFGKRAPIDMLLGAEHFFSLLCIGQISLGRSKPILQKSKLGWLISGTAAGTSTSHVICNVAQSVDDGLARFWQVEEIPSPPSQYDSHPSEQHFRKTTRRNSEGRFVVNIPTVHLEKLGDSREIALKRFLNIERSLNRQPHIKKQYVQFMNEYITLGHMSVSAETKQPVYYLPHHCVRKETSTTTKLRVVFDGSAKPIFGNSLNECQLVGPCIQDDLFSILLRFRKYPIVFTADITKMYRQILVDPEQRSLQRIFWRSNSNDTVQSFDLNTITYGTASASYLATRCLVEVANEIESSQPSISHCIKHDFYVDDFLSGANDADEAIKLINGVNSALNLACLPLRKWNSNRPEILQGLDRTSLSNVDFSSLENSTSNTLGLIWDSKLDILKYRINIVLNKPVTKRTILSNISEIFDPLGLLSPCIIIAKIIIQKLWSQRIHWDQSLPSNLFQEWVNYRDSLKTLNTISIPRHAMCENCVFVELHGFSDASIKAYGAVFYLRCVDNFGNTTCNLLCSKGRVAPLKTITIPRLELCGAHLLSILYNKISKLLNITFSSVKLWCDSTIVLAWIRQCPSTLQTFVGNRVSQIQGMTEGIEWRHVPTQDNPADGISRGLTPTQLINSALWFHGPNWLAEEQNCWPSNTYEPVELLELRPSATTSLHLSIKFENPIDTLKFSSFSKLIRVTSYVLRFLYNLRHPKEKRIGFLTFEERQISLNTILKFEQLTHFGAEVSALSLQKPIPTNTKILALAPFLDKTGMIRVGGRLSNSNLAYNVRHPILLPRSSHFVTLLFRHEHKRLFHIGQLGLLNAIRQNYWPLSGRNTARKTVHECILCFRSNPKSPTPEIGQLPVARVNPTPPFYHCGVDYAGPFSLKTLPGRGCKTYKAYVALFVCFSTKALHLELVTDLTTQAFIAALRRFVARRGKPSVVYSDNGSNFIGARRELHELGMFLKNHKDPLKAAVDSEAIDWKFIPARSPHFGGIWEAGVKSTKYHIKRIVGAQLLTYEDFYTFLVQVEAILNSRPLTPLSSDPNDISPLTPAHFLIGRTLINPPDEDFSDTVVSSCSRYKHAQSMSQHFWKRWVRDYLNTLQQRSKWSKSSEQSNIQIDTMVLLMDDGLPPMQWRLGRIVELHPGKDGVIRVISVKTTHGVIKRALRRVCPLPQENAGSTARHPATLSR